MDDKPELTEEAGLQALEGHASDRGALARGRHGPHIDEAALLRVLLDPSIVRYPTRLVYDDAPLLAGEFAAALPRGEEEEEARWVIVVHPRFRGRDDIVPALVGYHMVTVNYGEVATAGAAEAFGSALVGMEREAYYQLLCRAQDELAGETACGCGGGGTCR